MTGPKLTQRKIDKLRDSLHIVRECDLIQDEPLYLERIDEILLLTRQLTATLKKLERR